MYLPPARNLLRASPDAVSNGLSHQTIIIIAVCSSVGSLILAYFLYRILRSSCRSAPTVPLPPIQPLAHHREHQLAQFEQSQARQDTEYLSADPLPRFSRRSLSSKASLLGKESESHFSLTPTSAEDFSGLPVADPQQLLPPPLPSFLSSHPSSSSSSRSGDSSPTYTPPNHTGASQVPRPLSSWSPSATPLNDSVSASNTTPVRVRPKSVSSHHTMRSRSSRSNIRGAPHGPHSNVQIILPAPLAAGLSPGSSPGSDSPDRRSMVDRWVPTGRDRWVPTGRDRWVPTGRDGMDDASPGRAR